MKEFRPFPKLARLSRGMIVTEKLDGTNAQIYNAEDGEFLVGSRNRWITPDADNFGFARWAYEHEAELRELGPGQHFGEWWGAGIQRGYGIAEKRFSLFNVTRWRETPPPACCHIVPVLFEGDFSTATVDEVLAALQAGGSVASPGFMRPEGVVVFHAASRALYKKTLDDNDQHKGAL